MRRWSSVLLVVLLLALMGLARLPVPCLGDGHGNPCRATACACTAACSCKLACQAAAQAPASGHHACHMGVIPQEASAHFALPEAPLQTALAASFRLGPVAAGSYERPRPALRGESPWLPRPEPPPRPLA